MICLIGHGYVGSAIARELERQGLEFTWSRHAPLNVVGTVIINAAGFTGTPNVDECEVRREDTIRGNVLFPIMLENFGIPIVHITSGCVYTGYKDGGWTEEDRPNFTLANGSFYSGIKALAQDAIPKDRNYLLRIRLPFGHKDHPKNYLTKLKKYERLIDVRNSLSCLDDVARTAVFFALNRPAPGIYNVCNRGDVTTRDVAVLLGLRKAWFTEEEFKQAVVAPRSNCTLSTAKLEALMPVRPVSEALHEAVVGMLQEQNS